MTAPVSTDEPASSNGSSPHAAEKAIDELRRTPRNIHLARGFGPLIVAIVLFLLMIWIAPSVAPERIVQRPAPSPSVTVPSTRSSTATSAPTPTSAPTTTAGATP